MPSTALTLKGTTIRGPSSMPRTLEARSPELRLLNSCQRHRRIRTKQMRRSDNPTPRPRQSLDTSRSQGEIRTLRNAEPQEVKSVRWSAGDENYEKAHSRNAANFCRDSLQPSSLSSGRIPFGMSSQRIVISVPPLASAKLTVILISQANDGSCDSNSTTSTIFASGTSSTNLPWKVSASSEVLPANECLGFWYVSDIRNVPRSRASKACTWPLILFGASQEATESGSRKA